MKFEIPKNNIKKIAIIGSENNGWSLDKDHEITEYFIKNIGYELVKNIFFADIVYSVWWNKIDNPLHLVNSMLGKKYIVVISNDIKHQIRKIKKISKYVDHFICANKKQIEILLNIGINKNKISELPFYTDKKIFHKIDSEKSEISKLLGICYSNIKDKILIGSFQRDSEGNNLKKPKWQKDPEKLIEMMKKLPNEKYILLLAGPRRHFLVEQCKKNKINYMFFGDEKYIDNNQDDLHINNLDLKTMNGLYNLIDLYVVSSVSEGGPKSVIECVSSQCNILSTDVGLASEYLGKEYLYDSIDELVNKILENSYIKNNYEKNKDLKKIIDDEIYRERIKKILTGI